MKTLTTAKTAMISALLAIAVMAPATQAHAFSFGEALGDVGNFLDSGVKGAEDTFNTAKKGAIDFLSIKKPDLSTIWDSDFGIMDWKRGAYGAYGNKEKTLKGRLVADHNKGAYVYTGTWGRTSSSAGGAVTFTFSDSGRSFTGHYVSNGVIKAWNGSR